MLTPEELKICEMLGEVYNAFVKAPRLHPGDVEEMAFHIHAMQNMVMSRSAIRSHPDVFNILNFVEKP